MTPAANATRLRLHITRPGRARPAHLATASAGGNAGIRRSVVCLLLASVFLACGGGARVPDVTLASTTSTEDSGLLDVLLPAFSDAHGGIHVRLIAVGSGQALELGRRRDADVLLVHAPEAELAYMQDGHGRARVPVMYSDFVIVGPPADPAGVREAADAADAFGRIIRQGELFVSRGDDSGTHQMELGLWPAAGWPEPPGPPHRIEIGQGMGEALMMAAERTAYALADRATWQALSGALALDLHFDGDPRLINPYSVITVVGAGNEAGADLFAAWLTSADAAALIADFGSDRFGQPLFRAGAPPAAVSP